MNSIFKSFAYAFRGIVAVAREERNFRLQLVAAVLVWALACYLRVSGSEKAVISLAIGLVLVLELLNSAVERMVDILKPRIHHYVEEIKDIMAGAVLVSSLSAVATGVIIFWPYLSI